MLAPSFLFYLWTGTSSGNPIKLGPHGGDDDYNQLADGFLHGQLSLPALPPKTLVDLRDPYDPRLNAALAAPFHDLSLYHGHFYLAWGPSPVVTAFLPWRLLHVGALPMNAAVLAYSFVGLVFAVALMCLLVDRFLPDTPTWQVALGMLALATGNIAPFLLRRPDVYEVAISCGYCFLMAALYLFASGGFAQRRRPLRLALGSICLGLAVGGRTDLVFAVAIPVALGAYLIRADHVIEWRGRVQVATLLLGPFALIVLLLLLYNEARFGSFLQFGLKYQLAGVDQTKERFFDPAYLAPGLFYYLLAPIRWTLAFPYLALPPPPHYPGPVPSNYKSVEIVGGIFPSTPILLVLFAAPFRLWRRVQRELFVAIVLVLVLGIVTASGIALTLWGATMRYEMDFATLFLIPALLVWFRLGRLGWGRTVRRLGAVAILYGSVVGIAISITGYTNGLQFGSAHTYSVMERVTGPLPRLVTMAAGHPDITRIVPLGARPLGLSGTFAINKTAWPISSGRTEIDIVSPDRGEYALRADFEILPAATRGFRVAASARSDRWFDLIVTSSGGRRTVYKIKSGVWQIDVHLAPGFNQVFYGVTRTGAGNVTFRDVQLVRVDERV